MSGPVTPATVHPPLVVIAGLVALVLWRLYARSKRLIGRLGAGLVLGSYGLKLTRFESTSQGVFYTPHAHIGILLSLLLAGRVLYRLGGLWMAGLPTGGPPDDFVRSPLTIMIVCVLAGYYVTYAIGLLRWHRALGTRQAVAGG